MQPWTFGVEPLPDQVELATLIRSVASKMLAVERSDPALSEAVAALRIAVEALEPLQPQSLLPRVGSLVDSEGRAYIDHARDPGAFSPMFPVYAIEVHGEDLATGTVTFPICFEGPPGCVGGGFLSVFFDAVVQHHSCALGRSGKTRTLDVRYRRPTPLLTELEFRIERSIVDSSVHSEAELSLDSTVLCRAATDAVLGDRITVAVGARR